MDNNENFQPNNDEDTQNNYVPNSVPEDNSEANNTKNVDTSEAVIKINPIFVPIFAISSLILIFATVYLFANMPVLEQHSSLNYIYLNLTWVTFVAVYTAYMTIYWAIQGKITINNSFVKFPQRYYLLFGNNSTCNLDDIESMDFKVSGRQKLTINLSSGVSFKTSVKLFTKKSFINLVQEINKRKPTIRLSDTLSQFLYLTDGSGMTDAEKEHNRKMIPLIIFLVIVLILMFVAIWYFKRPSWQ